jgi:hypothetical protein
MSGSMQNQLQKPLDQDKVKKLAEENRDKRECFEQFD